MNRICPGCGIQNIDSINKCKLKCSLSGGDHLTEDKECKVRHKMTYIVRKRRRKHQRGKEESLQRCDGSSPGRWGRYLSRRCRRLSAARSDSRAMASSGDASATGARRRESRLRSKPKTKINVDEKQVGWADVPPVAITSRNLPPLVSTPPTSLSSGEKCKQCSELKQMTERRNQEIRALMERVQEFDKSKCGNSSRSNNGDANEVKRKVAIRDTISQTPPIASEPEAPPTTGLVPMDEEEA
ncbi:hypothetical protein HPB48_011341 [Haemaphysalis longicornis]|uniref:Uncharacterized protein n=1 Tax=Haemaphysalis longicornis TaxID=44386 RepID=A0A9J6GUD0_HAELO|nr:hypothetical protein HPB48_011341 [Haemaphysalis longicornis]